jgi:Bifunctional DNA primase/polymerase, N-terminal
MRPDVPATGASAEGTAGAGAGIAGDLNQRCGASVVTYPYNIETAQRAIDAGLYVFPCNPATKKPLVPWAAWSTNEAHALSFFEGCPAAMVGIDCGKSGLFVLDFDRGHQDGVDGCAAFDTLLDETGESFPFDQAPAVLTPSGGCHVYLRQILGREPLGNSNRNLPPGIDCRGEGGFTVAPGSVRSDGVFYETAPGFPDLVESYVNGTIPEVPAWIVAGIEWRCPSLPGVAAMLLDESDAAERLKRGRGIASKIASALAMVREGGRNNELNAAVCKLAGRATWSGMTESECRDLMAWACGINRYIRDDDWGAFNATFDSAWRFGIANPLRPPRDRNEDTSGVTIALKPKMAMARI